MNKSLSIPLRLLSLVATMTVGSMAFAVAPSPAVSISTNLGASTYGYTLEVTDAPAATGTAWVVNGKIYVLEGKPYTFKLTGTEHGNWYIGMKPTLDDGVALNHNGRNGSRSGAGPNSTFIYIAKTFNTGGTHLIGQVRYYDGPSFSPASMTPVPIEVYVIKVDINIRTDGERTPNMPTGFNTAYLYDPTEDEWGWGNPAWKALGFFTDPHGDSRGHMEGIGSITPAGLDTSAMEFRWRQKVLAEVVWVSPKSSASEPPGPDNPTGIFVDNIPNWNSAETELCIFMRDDPGGPFNGTITTASLQYRRRMNLESWVEIRFAGGTWVVCSDKEKWYIRYAFTRPTTNDAWQVDTGSPGEDNSVGTGTTSTAWDL